jgi:hypothetical protein
MAGGLRVIPQGDLSASLASYGKTLASHDLLQPAGTVEILSRLNDSWLLGAEVGYSPDRYLLGDGTAIAVNTVTIQPVFEWIAPIRSSRIALYVKIGIGYYFSSVTEQQAGAPTSVLSSALGGFAAAGLRLAAVPRFGFSIEERYALAWSALQELGAASVGGNTVTAGVYFSWFD